MFIVINKKNKYKMSTSSDFLKIFSCKDFATKNELNNISTQEEEDAENMLKKMMKIMEEEHRLEDCFDSYTLLLSQTDYLNLKFYKIVCKNAVNFINKNLNILTYDWAKDNPLCYTVKDEKVKKIKDLELNELENEELKNNMIRRINTNFNIFKEYMKLVHKLQVISKEEKNVIDKMIITEFTNSYGDTWDDIEE